MSDALARIWARAIHRGSKAIDDVPEKYRDKVRAAYLKLFGIAIEE